MKIKISKNHKNHSEELFIRSGKGEKLEYAQAEHLKSLTNSCFLAFRYTDNGAEDIQFFYPITNMIPLETYLKAKLSLSQFRAMLDDVTDTIESCALYNFDPAQLLFETKYLRLDADTNHLAFAYLPLSGIAGNRATVMGLLRHIAEKASFICAENKKDALLLLDYLKRQTVFSSVDFKQFLESTAFRKNPSESFTSNDPSLRVSSDFPTGQTPSEPLTSPHPSQPFSPFTSYGSNPPTSPNAPAAKPAEQAPTYDFIKTQVGVSSNQEARAHQTFAEKVVFDIADTPSSAPLSSKPSSPLVKNSPLTPASPLTTTPSPCPFIVVRLSNGDRFVLEKDTETSMGRSKQCAIRVTGNTNISRVHATLLATHDSCLLTDQGSTNKTYKEDFALKPKVPTKITRGMIFKLADEAFSLE